MRAYRFTVAAGVVLGLATSPALAAPPSEYVLTLTPVEIQQVATALSRQAYGDVFQIITKIQAQVNAQEAKAAEAAAPKASGKGKK